ncbi:MAG: FecCD family ABC transporter permease [Thermoplasmata archaeon]
MKNSTGSAALDLLMRRRMLMAVLLPVLLAISLAASLFFGAVGPVGLGVPRNMSLEEFFEALAGGNNEFVVIIRSIRLPRILLGALVGASLALSGAGMQGLFRNPLAEPYILGLSSGAALGATLWFVFGFGFLPGTMGLGFLAFVAGILTVFLVYNLSQVGGAIRTDTLLLAGIAMATLLSALTFFLLFLGQVGIQRTIYWLLGGLNLTTNGWLDVALLFPAVLAGALVLQVFSRDVNVMLTGEETATQLGVDVALVRRVLIVVPAVLTSLAVAVSGIIAFVGLIVPHIIRMLLGPSHRVLFPAAALGGAIFLVWADALARTVLAPGEIPLGIVTAFCGAPFFIYLLRQRRLSYAP